MNHEAIPISTVGSLGSLTDATIIQDLFDLLVVQQFFNARWVVECHSGGSFWVHLSAFALAPAFLP